MATIFKEFSVAAAPGAVWAAFKDVGAVDKLAKGFVTATRMAEPDTRIVTFANGMEARETIVSVDDARKRLAYWINRNERLIHHNGVFEVFADGAGSRVTWTVDLLPDEMAGPIGGMMDMGAAAMRESLGGG
ncbi:MAG: SRPBCC family protein [Hyphomonadaceae bacterium]|nr:SRPBCC family protein [Hyphomonadaceae bacterium]